MIVGILSIKLEIFEAYSLKEKRHVIKSLIGRLDSRFNISIAETGLNDSWQTSQISIAFVSTRKDHVEAVFSKIINFIDGDTRVQILDYHQEIV